MHVLIAPDKFKDSLTAAQAAAALAEGWRTGWPVDKPLEIECPPLADGGEGTAEAIHDVWQAGGSRSPFAIPSVESWRAAVKYSFRFYLASFENPTRLKNPPRE